MMMTRWRTAGAVALFAHTVCGQIDLALEVHHARVLQHEDVPIVLHMRNHAPATLRINGPDADARIQLDVRKASGRTVSRSRDLEPFDLPAREVTTREFDLIRLADLRDPDGYIVRARVTIGGRNYQSAPVFIDVLPGREMAAAVDHSAEQNGQRRYSLRTLSRDGSEWLFLRIDDLDRRTCYGVVPLGRLLRVAPPQIQVDEYGMANTLHRSGPSRYLHHVVSHDGLVLERTAYHARGTRAYLVLLEDGAVSVAGAPRMEEEQTEP